MGLTVQSNIISDSFLFDFIITDNDIVYYVVCIYCIVCNVLLLS